MQKEIIVNNFDLEKSVSCAQAFRWNQQEDGCWFGVASGKAVLIAQDDDRLILEMPEDDSAFWGDYFALDQDYAALEELLAQDDKTRSCVEYSSGIRVFRQEPFETLISFIISANNHLSRIKSLVEKISRQYGEKRCWESREYYLFPEPAELAAASEEELKALGCGYRAAYIRDSAQIVADGYDLEALKELLEEEACKALCFFPGVGPKVAACIALFSLGFSEAVPVDVWVKRVLAMLYPQTKPQEAVAQMKKRYGVLTGAAQQYLFHYARMAGLGKKKSAKNEREEKG